MVKIANKLEVMDVKELGLGDIPELNSRTWVCENPEVKTGLPLIPAADHWHIEVGDLYDQQAYINKSIAKAQLLAIVQAISLKHPGVIVEKFEEYRYKLLYTLSSVPWDGLEIGLFGCDVTDPID